MKMKKLKFWILVFLVSIAFVSCKNSFGLNIEEKSEEKLDVNVQNLLSKTRVNLFDGRQEAAYIGFPALLGSKVFRNEDADEIL